MAQSLIEQILSFVQHTFLRASSANLRARAAHLSSAISRLFSRFMPRSYSYFIQKSKQKLHASTKNNSHTAQYSMQNSLENSKLLQHCMPNCSECLTQIQHVTFARTNLISLP
jgi:hypothetical protein